MLPTNIIIVRSKCTLKMAQWYSKSIHLSIHTVNDLLSIRWSQSWLALDHLCVTAQCVYCGSDVELAQWHRPQFSELHEVFSALSRSSASPRLLMSLSLDTWSITSHCVFSHMPSAVCENFCPALTQESELVVFTYHIHTGYTFMGHLLKLANLH